jgi:dipeptidyl aminopeptidase/acylaminoacyl peptidase
MFDLFPGNKSWSLTGIRLLAESYYGGGEFNECYRTASRIRSGDTDSWHREWLATAKQVEEIGGMEEKAGHSQTARKAYFRASNYFRVAEFFLSHTDDRKIPTYLKSLACFHSAVKLSRGIELVEVPYGGATMPGYFLRPREPLEKSPVLIFMGGADSTAEELRFVGAREALIRGIACIIVDGPGRGGMLRLKKSIAIPDYEKPVRSVVDYLLSRADVDPGRIGIMGISMGGYYAARAAAYEKRIKACVVHYGCFDAYSDIYEYYPPLRTQMKWLVAAESEEQVREALSRFTLAGSVEQIECPLLILHGGDDAIINPGAAKRIFDGARCEKQLRFFEPGEPGSTHCGYDNHAEIFPFVHDWIQEKLSN